jgi:hypothetical protein
LSLTLSGPAGPAGPAGGGGGGGAITTSTETDLTGYIYGNGTTIAGATESSTGGNGTADAGKLVEFNTNGGARFRSNAEATYAVEAQCTDGTAIYGSSDTAFGVNGVSNSSVGIYGESTSGIAIQGYSASGYGVSASSSISDGIYAYSENGKGITSVSTGTYHAYFGDTGIQQSFVARLKGAFGWVRGAFNGRIQAADTLTADRTYTLPNDTGTIALINPSSGTQTFSGTQVFTGVTTIPLGSAALPSITPTGDPDTGIWSEGANVFNVSTGGSLRFKVFAGACETTNGIRAIGGSPSAIAYSFGNDTNTGMYSAGTDIIGFATNGLARWTVTSAGALVANPTSGGAIILGASGNSWDGSTITGEQAFSSTTRPTSSGSGVPDATSLITRDDADLRYGNYIISRLTADGTPIQSQTTLQDTGCSVDLPVGVWQIEAQTHVANANTAAAGKTAASVSGGTSSQEYGMVMWQIANSGVPSHDNQNWLTATRIFGTGSRYWTKYDGLVIVTAGTTTVKTQYAQNVSTAANTTVKLGTFITARKVG